MSEFPSFETGENQPRVSCELCGVVFDDVAKRFVAGGMIPVVLDDTVRECGEKGWDVQHMVACKCPAGAAHASRENKPMMTFARAVGGGRFTGWQTREMTWRARNYLLMFHGPDVAPRLPNPDRYVTPREFADSFEAAMGAKK